MLIIVLKKTFSCNLPQMGTKLTSPQFVFFFFVGLFALLLSIDRQKSFGHISSIDQFQRFLPSQISKHRAQVGFAK